MLCATMRERIIHMYMARTKEPSEAWQAKLKEVDPPADSICSICLEPLSVLEEPQLDQQAAQSSSLLKTDLNRTGHHWNAAGTFTENQHRRQDLDRLLKKILRNGPHSNTTMLALLGNAIDEVTSSVPVENTDEWEQQDWRVGVWHRQSSQDVALEGSREEVDDGGDEDTQQWQEHDIAWHCHRSTANAKLAKVDKKSTGAVACRPAISACQLPCGHIFCRPCITGWLQRQQVTCPMCRKEVVPQRKQFNFYTWLFDFPGPCITPSECQS